MFKSHDQKLNELDVEQERETIFNILEVAPSSLPPNRESLSSAARATELGLLRALRGSGARKDQRGYELTLTMEETVSSQPEPETEQKTPHHCSANALTAGDLGPELPGSVRGGTGAREVSERLHRHPSTSPAESLHP